MTTSAPPEENRGSPRDSLFLLANCQLPQRQVEQRVKLRNISASGLMAEGTLRPQVGEPVCLELRNVGRVDGIVAWVRDNRFGVAFTYEIDPHLVRQTADLATAAESDMRSYYQRGPVGVVRRQDETLHSRLRTI
jgi:hypothetical protein